MISQPTINCLTTIYSKQLPRQKQWHAPVIPALKRLRQEDQEVQAILSYTASSRTDWVTG
jgi:hypothetical protein